MSGGTSDPGGLPPSLWCVHHLTKGILFETWPSVTQMWLRSGTVSSWQTDEGQQHRTESNRHVSTTWPPWGASKATRTSLREICCKLAPVCSALPIQHRQFWPKLKGGLWQSIPEPGKDNNSNNSFQSTKSAEWFWNRQSIFLRGIRRPLLRHDVLPRLNLCGWVQINPSHLQDYNRTNPATATLWCPCFYLEWELNNFLTSRGGGNSDEGVVKEDSRGTKGSASYQ